MPNTETLEKLASFDTPTICNIIELFDVRPYSSGYMDGRVKACFPEMPPIVGYAATATFRSASPPQQGAGYGSIATQVERFAELDGPPIVIFQDLDNPIAAAVFGEIMCSTYKAFGAVGLITDGAGRDLDQVRAINFPLFTSGAICSHGYNHIPDVHVPVHVGGVMIHPNDLIHADVNGVTTIPVEIAAEVADLGDDYMAMEAIVLDVVQNGSPTLVELRVAMRESDDMKAKLHAQATRHGK